MGDLKLYTPKEIEEGSVESSEELEILKTIYDDYIVGFLSRAHPDLGRKGPVCPFVPRSLKQNTIYLGIISTHGRKVSEREIEDILFRTKNRFLSLEPTDSLYKAAMIIFPDLSYEETLVYIDGIQRKIKPAFVREGLMIGEFHKNNNSPGLHNSSFFPLRTELPALAMRSLVPGDLNFMILDGYCPELRVDLLESYLKFFGEKNIKEVAIAKAELEKAKSLLH